MEAEAASYLTQLLFTMIGRLGVFIVFFLFLVKDSAESRA